MTLGTQIGLHRRKRNMTQEDLAQKLSVTNQAVSKWESDQCCPDIGLLPQIADIFEISIDELFGRKHSCNSTLPWEDDNTLRAVLYLGHCLVENHPAAETVTLDCGDVKGNLSSAFSVSCGDVSGSVSAGGKVCCGDIDGPVSAGGNVECGDIDGAVKAGGNVECGDISGSATAGGSICCGDVDGDAVAGTSISCGDVGGNCSSGK